VTTREALWLFAAQGLLVSSGSCWRSACRSSSALGRLLLAAIPSPSFHSAGLSGHRSAGILMAYAAHLDGVPAEAWWLLLANVFWAVAYDTEYAMVDRNDDLKIGIKTSAILLALTWRR
jgi:4-hydroxybenzoate polyprenyltransferase